MQILSREKEMKKSVIILIVLILAAGTLVNGCSCRPVSSARPMGHLFIIGGGDRSEDLMQKYVDLVKKTGREKVVVFTMASSIPEEVGPALVEEIKNLGVKDVSYFHLNREEALDPERARILDGAGGVFFSGGDQSKLTSVLLDTPVIERVLSLYREGAVVGGTSAGAAVMSEVMITGDEKRQVEAGHEWETIESGNVVTSRGFGFIREAIIDQHFITRRRHNRLISLMLEKPGLIGVGIDESTAILVRPDGYFEVLGENQVVIYDARRAHILPAKEKKPGATGINMHILVSGCVFSLERGRIEVMK